MRTSELKGPYAFFLHCHGSASKKRHDVWALDAEVAMEKTHRAPEGEEQISVHPGTVITVSHSVSFSGLKCRANNQDQQNKSCCSCQAPRPAGFNLGEYSTHYSAFSSSVGGGSMNHERCLKHTNISSPVLPLCERNAVWIHLPPYLMLWLVEGFGIICNYILVQFYSLCVPVSPYTVMIADGSDTHNINPL